MEKKIKITVDKVIKKAKAYDYRNYDPARCRNGGWYGFWTTYELSNEKELRLGLETEPLYAVSYGTTAEFDYCEYCGSWSSCGCGKIYEHVSEKRLLADMRRADEDPSPELWTEVLEEVDITPTADWANIRRRCEDALRKCINNRTIFDAAKLLGVNMEE